MKQPCNADRYPDFDFPASSLAKFIAAGDIFTILLKNGEIVHYTPKDQASFHQWLVNHHIVDVKADW